MAPQYITKEEAVAFITNKLHLPLTDEELSIPSFSALQKICCRFCVEWPFTTIPILNVTEVARRVPTYDELKGMLHQMGGLCYETNVILYWVLLALGYDVHPLLTMAHGLGVYNHSSLTVDLDGKTYYVDPSLYPWCCQNLMCLNFDGDVSPIYKQSMFRLRLHKAVVDGKAGFLLKFHSNPNTDIPPLNLSIDEEGWASVLQFPIGHRRLEELTDMVAYSRSEEGAKSSSVIFHLVAGRYPNERMVHLMGTSLTYEDEHAVRHKVKANSRDELIALIKTYFANFDEDTILGAVDRFYEISRKKQPLVAN